MFNIFKWFKPKKSPLQSRIDVFENIYSSLLQDWNEYADIDMCSITIDVSQFSEQLDEWIRVINKYVHVYNKVIFYLEASSTTECGFLSCKEVLTVKLTEPPHILTGSIKA